MEKKMTYEAALLQLEDIVRRMENDELDVDNLASQLKQAQRLVKLCRDRLASADAEIKKLLDSGKKA